MKKVIELAILPEDQESGVTAISLVDRPAIEVDFLFFKKEEMVEPGPTESRDEFISRCISVLVGEGKPEDQAAAICYSKWEDQYGEQFEQPGHIGEIYTQYQLETMIELAKTLGVSGSSVEVSKEKFSKVVNETMAEADVIYLYHYTESGVAGNSRNFCSAMMSIDRYFTRAEILILDDMNNEFGPGVGGGRYNVFKYKGGANCQHYWSKFRAVKVNDSYFITPVEPSTQEERIAATAPRTFQGRGFVKRPERNLPPLGGHSAFSFAEEDKRIIVSPIMIPDIEIRRVDDNNDEYFVKFSPETIMEIAQKFMKQARTNETNIDHQERLDAGSYLFESWIVENSEDKAITQYGFDVPIGTWCGKFKVEDDAVWEKIKNGELRGVSVEGWFLDAEEIEAKKQYEKIRRILSD